ncbi:hypothetical protein [Amaricoccus sp.]|mgnify:CR=1 FL=1|uniref:hypothetical protein n=1 Tax=Amaricoccus sp. TaxID=1872485 RepID=UPI002639E808|nr:hypothetical protein [Amaricoccus sp.]HRO10948.1 hypothetical protein [Amaricoccus sp.]
MSFVSPKEFAEALGISERIARRAFARGRPCHGHALPVIEVPGQRGGAGGKVWALSLDHCSPELRAILQPAASSPVEVPVKGGLAAPTIRLKGRSDRGRRRVIVTRAWDAGIDLPEDRKRAIAGELAREARSMVANDGTSNREVLRLCAFHLARRCEAAGSALAPARLRAICALNQKWAKRQGLNRFRLVHKHDCDHKAWQDEAVPRIRRALHDTPMGLLIGDVHYVDILVDENGETVRVRLIAWLDASSLFAWVTPVFLSKGKGVRQEDVAEALSQVAFCPHGGIPQEYYLDNGSEYSKLKSAMDRLADLAGMQFSVTAAKPYSPTSKGEIEGFFNILEGIFRGLPGWIGGDRTNKKTENKGMVVKPYERGLDALAADIRDAVRIYNDRPQSGRLGGLSPVEALDAKIRATRFSARVPSDDAFDLIFSRPETRIARQGMITIRGALYHSPRMDDLPVGARLEVRVPLRKGRDRVFLRHESDDLGWAELQPVFAHGERAGARHQAELEKGRTDALEHLRAQTDPTVSTFELQKAAVRQVAPAAGDPEAWTFAIDKTLLPPSPADRAEAEDAERRAIMEEFLAMSAKSERPAAATAGLSGAT